MSRPQRRADRRGQHTREVLLRTFSELVREKGFAAMSVGEIARRANINRGTFYLHFTDKYALTDAVVRALFREELGRRLPMVIGWDRASLRLLVEAVLGCLEGKYRHQQRPLYALAAVAPLVERAMHQELLELLVRWFSQGQGASASAHELSQLEQSARIVSWAIFGSALQWSQEPMMLGIQETADAIVALVLGGMAARNPALVPS